jgi:hypothetical protein
MEDLALPAALVGPVLNWALARLAARRASEIGWVSGSEKPKVAPAAKACSVGSAFSAE